MIRSVAVVVPAADEQQQIGGCLTAIDRARANLRRHRPDVDVRVVVALDACTDETGAIAAAAGAQTVAGTARLVGAARALGCRQAMIDAGRPSELWLANTDADSRVPADWLTRMIAEAEHGAGLVLGTVVPDDDLAGEVAARWWRLHRLRTGHPHVHGANLGVRADVYSALGGWSPVATGEDELLAEQAGRRPGVRIARIASIPVTTSSRRAARAPAGFAAYLTDLARQVTPAEAH